MPMNPRLLRPKATAPAGFDPRTIAGLALWLDAADSATLFDATTGGSLVSAGGAVGRWEDKSGNGRHATEGVANNRPLRSAASVNGLDAILYDGNNDRLTTSSFSLSQPLTVLAVVRFAVTGFSTIVDGAPSGNRVQAGSLADGRLRMFAGAIFDTSSVAFAQNVTALVAGLYNGSSSQHRVNSQFFSSPNATPGTSGLTLGARIGASQDGSFPVNGRICEVLYYGNLLSASQLSAVERYLASKWGIALPPTASNVEAQDWINRVYVNGGTVSATTANAVNDFCNSIAAESGLRAAILRLNLFCGNSDASLNAVRTPLYLSGSFGGTTIGNTTDTNFNFVSGDYQETGSGGGLKGNASNKYLNTGLAPNSLASVASVHLSCSATSLETTSGATNTSGDRFVMGTFNNAEGGLYDIAATAWLATGGANLRFSRLSTFSPSTVSSSSRGASEAHFIGSRTSSSQFNLYDTSGSIGSSTSSTSGSGHSFPFFVFSLNLNGSPGVYSAARLRMYSIGNGLTAAQALAFSNAVVAFNTALGRA